ncbi:MULTISPECIES: CHAD domain-containing protein [unclassified Pseudonocardia]|uniref:CHAD domain-containing protein n=1 Tax=unclassified Pseudonocardia TaxID=2619320 RepID=UPI0001FFF40E|nr:CHAD domain-containing protein [Pseudonocardia sp. Ae707_Ps1]OLM16548.1 Adenylate cyclase [Pseudonocardia sp. Ae707_Ps1]
MDGAPQPPSNLYGVADLGERLTAGPGEPAVAHVRALLDKRLRAMLHHEPGVRDGSDIEELHQMRVAVRRMRAALKAARPLLDHTWADGLRSDLGRLGRALGPVRDLDVMIERLRGEVATLPPAEQDAGDRLVGVLEAERIAARAEMLDELDSDRHTALRRHLVEAVSEPLPEPPDEVARPALIDLVRAETRKLTKAVRRAGENPPDMTLHDLRIRTKRLRYTGELVEPAMRDDDGDRTKDAKHVKKMLKAAEGLQEVLGDHQDACVAEHRIRALLDELGNSPDAHEVFVGGRLVERERARAEDLRTRWWDAWLELSERAEKL